MSEEQDLLNLLSIKKNIDLHNCENNIKLQLALIKSGFPFNPSWYQDTEELSDYCNKMKGRKHISKMVCGKSIQEFVINWGIACFEVFDEMETKDLRFEAQTQFKER